MFFFSKNNEYSFELNTIEHAYFLILKDDLSSAKSILKMIDSPRSNWGLSFIQILEGYLEIFPSYFGIRNFIEIDLDFLLKNNKIEYVEQILGSLSILETINQEIYKYIARVMFENKLYKATREYLDKSKNILYNDPELHFLYAKYYLRTREYELADNHLEECINILPDYYPAKLLKKEISRYLA